MCLRRGASGEGGRVQRLGVQAGLDGETAVPRDREAQVVFEPRLCGSQGVEVLVDGAEAVGAASLVVAPDPSGRVPRRRDQHDDSGLFEAGGPLPLVAVQSADALKEHIDGAQVRDQKVRVQIQALLGGLRGNRDATSLGALLAEGGLQGCIERQPVLPSVPGVVGSRLACAGEQEGAVMRCLKRFLDCQRSPHGVADDQNPRVGSRSFQGPERNGLGVQHHGAEANRDLLPVAGSLDRRAGRTARGLPGDQRIRHGQSGGEVCVLLRVDACRRGSEQAPPGCVLQGGRQEQCMAACATVTFEDILEQTRHVDVGGVDLIDHEQAAEQRHGTKVGVGHRQGRQQHLIDGADDDRSGEVPLGVLGCPRAVP